MPGTNLSDTWAYDGTAWTQLVVPGPQPMARVFHACVFDAACDRLLRIALGFGLAVPPAATASAASACRCRRPRCWRGCWFYSAGVLWEPTRAG